MEGVFIKFLIYSNFPHPSQYIRQRITKGKTGKIIFAKDFSDIGNDELINKALFRLERNKTLIRLSHGIYLYPVVDKELGVMLPSPETIAKAIAKRDNARILPTGNHAILSWVFPFI